MSNYGRNFEFRISPPPDQRRGRYINGNAAIPIGAPIKITAVVNADGRNEVALAAGVTIPRSGQTGLAVFEHTYNAFAGFDPTLVVPSDFNDVPAGAPLQMVSGTEVKVVLRNTVNSDFLGRAYTDGRMMVAPADLSTIAVGDVLRPGPGTAVGGYWVEAAGVEAADGWLLVTLVDTARGEVEAQLLF